MRTLTSLATLFLIPMALTAQDPRDIADRASRAVEFDAMEMATTLKIFDNRGNERVRQVATATRKFGSTTMTMIRFLAPADVQGTAMFIHDHQEGADDMWIYLPSLRRERRIVSSERGKSFMGSEFTNADMARPNLNDFTYKLLGSKTINGIDCWVVESTPKNEEIAELNGFSRQVSYVGKSNFLAHQVEYYDQSNRLHKVMTIGDYRKQGNGKMFAFRMEVQNVQNQRRSLMIVDKFQMGSSLTQAQFTVANMSR